MASKAETEPGDEQDTPKCRSNKTIWRSNALPPVVHGQCRRLNNWKIDPGPLISPMKLITIQQDFMQETHRRIGNSLSVAQCEVSLKSLPYL